MRRMLSANMKLLNSDNGKLLKSHTHNYILNDRLCWIFGGKFIVNYNTNSENIKYMYHYQQLWKLLRAFRIEQPITNEKSY